MQGEVMAYFQVLFQISHGGAKNEEKKSGQSPVWDPNPRSMKYEAQIL
jgi:hypothetical protein